MPWNPSDLTNVWPYGAIWGKQHLNDRTASVARISDEKNIKQIVFWLVFLFFVLQPVGKTFEVSYALLALIGFVFFWRGPCQVWDSQGARYYIYLFILFYLPIVFSCFGAHNFDKAFRVAWLFPRILPAGIIVFWCFKSTELFRKLDVLVAAVLLIWIADALFQTVLGYDVFGYVPPPGRLGSVFLKHPLKFGNLLAIFSPFLLVAAVRRGTVWLSVALLLSGGVVFLAGSRGGWIAYVVAVAGLFLYHLVVTKKLSWLFVAILLVCFVGVGTLAYSYHPPLRDKVAQSLLVLADDEASINKAITYRVPIWRTAWRMLAENPFNGVGARGFRYAYEDYSLQKDLYVEPGSSVIGAYHAHQLLMDVGSETGGFGLLGLLGSYVVLSVVWLRAPKPNKEIMLPYGLALLAALFPLNTHFATYSSSWSATIFLLIALFCAASNVKGCNKNDLR